MTTTEATRRALRAGSVLLAAAALGCSSLPPPRELDLGRMQVVALDTPPRLDVNALPGGKAAGAGVGAGTGSGAGAVAGAVACIATGPFFPLCVMTVVPATAAVGAVTGGVIGAVRSETVEEIALKTQAVRDHLAGSAYQHAIARQLQEELGGGRAAGAAAPQLPTSGGLEPAPSWTLDVAVVELGTEGKREFALRLVARVTLRRSGTVEPVWSVAKEVQSENELTTDRLGGRRRPGHAGGARPLQPRGRRAVPHRPDAALRRPGRASASAQPLLDVVQRRCDRGDRRARRTGPVARTGSARRLGRDVNSRRSRAGRARAGRSPACP